MSIPSVRPFLLAALPALFATPFAWGQPIDSLPPGHWYEVPNSHLSSLDPCPARNCSYSGIEGQSAVMTNWAGGAYDSTRDRLVVWGGGHAGYAGNEVYAFDVNGLAWQRLTEPSPITANDPAPPNTTTYYADGKPSSRHSYNYLEYAPNVDRFFSVSAAATYGPAGGGGYSVDAFDFDTLTWSARTQVIEASSGYSSTIGSKAIYDSATGYLWYHNCLSGNLKRYDPVGDTWANHVATYVHYYSTAAIDPGRRLLVMVGAGDGTSGNPGLQVWDLAHPDTPPIRPATQGDAALQTAQAPGFVFDPVNRQFVGWNGGADVYLLQVPASPFTSTWTWTRVGPAAGNTVVPTAAEARGTYGRFRYIPSKNAFIVVNRTTENVYVYRASDLIFKDGFGQGNLSASVPSVPTGGSTAPSGSASTSVPAEAWGAASPAVGSEDAGRLSDRSSDAPGTEGAASGGSAPAPDTVAVAATPSADVVALRLVSTAGVAQPEVPVTFGHAFKAGGIPAGIDLAARLSDGTPLPLQVDKKATHADGSLRHAVLTLRLPQLGALASQTVTLATGTPTSGSPVQLSDLLASAFEAQVSLDVGGTVYSASARNLLGTTTPLTWLSGPEVSEWIAGGPVRNAGGSAHPHLSAYFHLRAYGKPVTRVRVDAIVENGWTFAAGSTSFLYNGTISVAGQTAYQTTTDHPSGLNHYHHSRWHKVLWWGAAPQVYVQPDTRYLRDTKAVPNYQELALQEAVLDSYTQSYLPMGRADLRAYWPDTGYGRQIGLLPEWDAAFLISGDRRAYNGVLANASAGGSYSYHYRDENTGVIPTIDAYPDLSEQGPSGGLVWGSGGNVYTHGVSHHPSIGYLAYLLTGDYFYLEEMEFMANWTMLYNNATYRGGSQGVITGQNRSQAWAIRSLGQVASILPDSFTAGGVNLKSYFVAKLGNNVANRTNYWPSQNILGGIQDYDWNPPTRYKYSPWQNDFFAAVFGYVVDLGHASATTMRNWLAQWPTGRMGQGNNGYCWAYAAQYNFDAGIVDSQNQYYGSFLQLYQANYPAASQQPCPTSGLMQPSAYPDSYGGYYSNMQPGLAYAVDAGVATAATWNAFVSAGTPDYTAGPVWAVVPRPPSDLIFQNGFE